MRILISNISSYKSIVIANFIKSAYEDTFIIGTDSMKIIGVFHVNTIDSFHLAMNNGADPHSVSRFFMDDSVLQITNLLTDEFDVSKGI